MKEFFRKRGQTILTLLLFLCSAHYTIQKATDAYIQARFYRSFDFVEVAFFLHNLVFLAIILVRRQHEAINKNVFHQFVSLVAFFSGIAFVQTGTPGVVQLRTAQVVTAGALVLGILTMINLGRSFGILIAIRKVQTGGLYGIIRHPMYFTDILWRIGIVVKNPCPLNLIVFVVSSGCYVYRALLEERFLANWPEYREYMQRVRYRFLPGIF